MWRKKALAALALGATISEAARVAGVARRTIYHNVDVDPEFKKAYDDAVEQGTDIIEAEATRRAVHGVDEPVIYQGRVSFVGFDKDNNPCDPLSPICVRQEPLTVRKPSDVLAIFILKGRRPEKFRDNHAVDVTSGGKPIKAYVGIDVEQV